ncbi:hypothetical protein BY458DRAFT_551712 [Sporodiniella umbellata]|nr:hypothetical protein BY458DRAFT_551712 [Sporodiniella umbellata]
MAWWWSCGVLRLTVLCLVWPTEMELINYNDLQNQALMDKEHFFDEKMKRVEEIMNLDNSEHIYNVYRGLIDEDETIKYDNIETVIFIINILLTMHRDDEFKTIDELFISYSSQMSKLYRNTNDYETIAIIFYTYTKKICRCDVGGIFSRLA